MPLNFLSLLGRFYASALIDSQIKFDMLFGPAYKGIPLASTCAIALEHLIAYLQGNTELAQYYDTVLAYREQYGV